MINRGDYVGGVYQGNNHITDAYGQKYYGESMRIDLKELIILREYKIYPFELFSAFARAPGSFRVYGSTDNMTHYLLDEEINQTYTAVGKTFYIPSNYTGYRYYTLIINKQAGIDNRNDNIGFGEWELYRVKEIRCLEYNWDIPEITLNKNGKISMEEKAYNTHTPTTIATTTRINNIGSTKYNYNSKNNGVIIDVSHWDYSKKKKYKMSCYTISTSGNKQNIFINSTRR